MTTGVPIVRRVGAQVHAGGVDELGGEAEPGRGVVVAARHDDAHARREQPAQCVAGQLDGVDRGQRAVEDVAADHDEVDLLRRHDVDDVVDEGALRIEHALTVERPAKVPVGGVQDAHGRTLGGQTDTIAAHTPVGGRRQTRSR